MSAVFDQATTNEHTDYKIVYNGKLILSLSKLLLYFLINLLHLFKRRIIR